MNVSEFNLDEQSGKVYVEYDNGTGVEKDLAHAITGKLNTTTGVVTLDDASRAALAASSDMRNAKLIGVVWGDSLSANGYTTNGATTAMHWLRVADAQLGGVFKHIINGGVSGERTNAMVSRLDALLANNPDVFIIGPNSVNDIDPAKGTILTPIETQANYELAFAKAFATPSVRQVWVATVHRPSSTYIANTNATGEATRQWYDSMDTYIRQKAALDPRIVIIEFARAVSDSLGVGLRANFNATSSDVTHIGYLGASAVAAAVKPVMQRLPFTPWNMPGFGQDFRNLVGPYASALQGSFASGSGNVQAGTGITLTTAPGGLNVRRMTGDSTTTATSVNAQASPVGLPGQAVTLDFTIGQVAGGAGVQFGAAATGNFDNARANSAAYTWGSRIQLSSTLCGQCLVPGTSAASAPDFSAAVAGTRIVDGSVTWLVTEIPQIGDTLLIEADMSLTANVGGASPVVWINFIDNLGNQYSSWINVANATNQLAWPTDTGRFLLRNYLPIPAITGSAIRNIALLVGVQGANGATGTLQVHRASINRGV